ncbi:MAG: hypothetical protein OEZ19_05830 [Paracoccaceae bacterium]|nr:hypothetical protein [Paracoccaceae bacterium]
MKTLMIAVAVLTISTPAFAKDAKPAEFDLQPLPEEVRANIEELRQYGDRFEKAIAAIEAQWAKPMWTNSTSCEDTSEIKAKAGS